MDDFHLDLLLLDLFLLLMLLGRLMIEDGAKFDHYEAESNKCSNKQKRSNE